MTEPTPESARYPDKPRLWLMALTMLFCAPSSWGLAQTAADNLRNMRLFHLITLAPSMATGVLWGMAAISGVIALFGLYGGWRAGGSDQVVIVTQAAVIVPEAALHKTDTEIHLIRSPALNRFAFRASVSYISTIRAGRRRRPGRSFVPARRSMRVFPR